ncbi:MAG: polyisoprenoid-binding protein [Nitrospirae bacterium]|nr:polyisoprenoid-binding protein [Nitrospirota bacterium]
MAEKIVLGIIVSVVLMIALGISQAEMARYDVDLDHSTIEFRVAHMVISKTTGRFMDYTGYIEMDPDALKVKALEAVIKTASVTTNHEKRDAHLRGSDFFNTEKYPTMTYKMKSYHKEGEDYVVVGDLTLLGVTKEITLKGSFNGATKDPWGDTRAGFTGEGKLNRKDFGMNWNKVLDNGGVVVGDEVLIKLDIECIKAKPKG